MLHTCGQPAEILEKACWMIPEDHLVAGFDPDLLNQRRSRITRHGSVHRRGCALLFRCRGKLFNHKILVGVDAGSAGNLHGFLSNLASREFGVVHQGTCGSQGIWPSTADGRHAAVRFDYVSGAADQKCQMWVGDEKQSFKMTQGFVSPPFFCEFDRSTAE